MSRPSWDEAPSWANYLTMDQDGYWEWHQSRPRIDGKHNQYWTSDGEIIKASDGGFSWLDSLEERP